MKNALYFLLSFLTVAILMVSCTDADAAWPGDCSVIAQSCTAGWNVNYWKNVPTIDGSGNFSDQDWIYGSYANRYNCQFHSLYYENGQWNQQSYKQWYVTSPPGWPENSEVIALEGCPQPECTGGIVLGGQTDVPGLGVEFACIDECEYVPTDIDPITISRKNENDEWITEYYGMVSTGENCVAGSEESTNDPDAEQPPEMVGAPYPLTRDEATGDITGDNDKDGIPNSVDADIDGDGTPNADDPDVDGDGVPNGVDKDVDSDGVSNGGQDGFATNPRVYIFPAATQDPSGASSDPDVDGDGDMNGWDPDVDGDGHPNGSDADIDGDGIPNGPDVDSDGDGQLDGIDSDSDGDGLLDENDPDPDGSNNTEPEEIGEATLPELPGTPDGEGIELTFQPLLDVRSELMSKAPFNTVSQLTGGFSKLGVTASAPVFTIDLWITEATIDFGFLDGTATTCRSILSFFMYLFTGVFIVRVFMER